MKYGKENGSLDRGSEVTEQESYLKWLNARAAPII
jgi:hypothetical protein